MTEHNDPHTPNPEFTAFLARDLARTLRRESRFAASIAPRRGWRLRTPMAVAIGLIAGVSAGFASTEVAEARQREQIASATIAMRELATVQRDLARANYDEVQRAFERGAIPQAARLTAETELRARESTVARIELDLAESRQSAAPPRDELWAPLVSGRDFVKERLDIEVASSKQRLASFEAAAADADAQADVLEAKRNLSAVTHKLALRRQFLDENLTPEEVARRLQRFELKADVERAEQLLRLAQERLALARRRSGLGAPAEVKAKQAEVAGLEVSIQLEQRRLESALVVLTTIESTQQPVPTVSLPAASARTSLPLRNVLGVRELADGRLLVNDVGSRALKLFDAALATSTVTLDSTTAFANSYGPARVLLTRYLGDSSLLADPQSGTIRVIDGTGHVARAVAIPPSTFDLSGPSYIDDRGRLFYAAFGGWGGRGPADSIAILRFDLSSRQIDTVGRLGSVSPDSGPGRGERRGAIGETVWFTRTGRVSPGGFVGSHDDWAVLSDGSVAFVRGNDYHIDWVRPNGARASTAKLPFDWQSLNDTAGVRAYLAKTPITFRARTGDSVRVIVDSAYTRAITRLSYSLHLVGGGNSSSVIPDLDGNLWILPSHAAGPEDQLVYDVVNARGELFQRVRLTPGRRIAGFGRNGTVYLQVSGYGVTIERTRFTAGRR